MTLVFEHQEKKKEIEFETSHAALRGGKKAHTDKTNQTTIFKIGIY